MRIMKPGFFSLLDSLEMEFEGVMVISPYSRLQARA